MRDFNGYIFSEVVKQVEVDCKESYLLGLRLHSYEFFDIAKEFYNKDEITHDSYVEFKILVDYDKLDFITANYLEEYLKDDNLPDFFNLVEFGALQNIQKHLNEYLKINGFDS